MNCNLMSIRSCPQQDGSSTASGRPGDAVAGIGRTNDAMLYGANVTFAQMQLMKK